MAKSKSGSKSAGMRKAMTSKPGEGQKAKKQPAPSRKQAMGPGSRGGC